jgi:hypothetical protein
MSDITMNSTVVVAKEQMSCGLDDEAVILSLDKGTYYTLNPLGSQIWNLIQKPIKVEKIRDTILEEYSIDKETCETDLLSLLDDLKKEGLIVLEGPGSS